MESPNSSREPSSTSSPAGDGAHGGSHGAFTPRAVLCALLAVEQHFLPVLKLPMGAHGAVGRWELCGAAAFPA